MKAHLRCVLLASLKAVSSESMPYSLYEWHKGWMGFTFPGKNLEGGWGPKRCLWEDPWLRAPVYFKFKTITNCYLNSSKNQGGWRHRVEKAKRPCTVFSLKLTNSWLHVRKLFNRKGSCLLEIAITCLKKSGTLCGWLFFQVTTVLLFEQAFLWAWHFINNGPLPGMWFSENFPVLLKNV